jgi:DNA-binding Lrp family transcriptional regulator
MDDTDRKLLLLLALNPRMSCQVLAKRVGIARQTVQKRVQNLTRVGVFDRMTAHVSSNYLNAVPVVMFGKSNRAWTEDVFDMLGESEFSRGAIIAGGNTLYVTGILRDVSELGKYVKHVKQIAEMPDPTVGIFSLDDGIMSEDADGLRPKDSYKKLSQLDLKIITTLKGGVRKSVREIADELGVSSKTVSRRLDAMISDGSLDFNAPWDLCPGKDMFTLMHVVLRGGADKEEVGRRLLSECPVQSMYTRTFINLPNLLWCILCSDNMVDIRKVLEAVGQDEDVLVVEPNLLFYERMYCTTWQDELTAVETLQAMEARRKNTHS